MDTAEFRFHGEVKDFLSSGNKTGHLLYPLQRRASIKDVIESLGPPHTEIGRIIVNGQEKDFTHIVQPEDKIDVFPQPIPVPVCRATRLRPDPFDSIRFLVDVNVGKLAVFLRMLGLDAAYDPDWRDQKIAEKSEQEKRIVLTRDSNLLKRSQVVYGRLIRAVHPEDQLKEVLYWFGLDGPFAFFSRCLVCNVPLSDVRKADILHRLEPKTRKYFHTFRICPSCERIYWKGSHHERMRRRLVRMGIPLDTSCPTAHNHLC
ncbi:MAG: Mut7-C RNAse domain-containing protein [Desulfovibrionales bacterium]